MEFNMTHQQAQRATLEHCSSPSSAQKALKALLFDDMRAAWRTLRVVLRYIALMCSVFFFRSFSRLFFYQLSFHLSLTPAEGSQQVDTLANLWSFPLFFLCYSCIGVVLFVREVFLNRKRYTKCVEAYLYSLHLCRPQKNTNNNMNMWSLYEGSQLHLAIAASLWYPYVNANGSCFFINVRVLYQRSTQHFLSFFLEGIMCQRPERVHSMAAGNQE